MAVVRRRGECGSALVCVLMVTTLMATLSAAVVLVAMSESMASANHGAAQQALYAADAALEQTIAEFAPADWPSLPGVAVSERLDDGAVAARAPDGTVLDLAALAVARQAESDTTFGPSPNRPLWRLFGHAPFSYLAPAGLRVPPAYLLVWVADDASERDGDRSRDSNKVLLVRAEAYGIGSAHRAIDATLVLLMDPSGVGGEGGAPPPAVRRGVRLMSWNEVR